MDNEKLIEQIKKEIQMGLEYIQPKREQYRENLIKYVDQDKPDNKIWVNTIYSIINLLIAIKLSDKSQVLFKPRWFGDEEYADLLTNMAAYDYNEMELNKKDYARHWDTAFFGYAIKTKKGRDDIKKVPMVQQEDPLTWIPDPYSDYLTAPRFHYFEKQILKSEISIDNGFLIDWEDLTQWGNQDIENNQVYRNKAGWFNNVTEDLSNNYYIDCYDGFTYIDGELYMVTLDNTFQLIRKEKIAPVRKEEKETGFIDIRTQVTIERLSPLRWSVTWINLLDLIKDKQVANSELLNLRLIDARFSTFWQNYLVNTDIVNNVNDLSKPSVNPKWIKVKNWNNSLANAVYPVPRQNILSDSYNVSNELSKQLQLDTWISENTLGIAEKNITLGQSQQVQANANLRLSLGITISNWWEVDFWNYIWLRSYEEYLSSTDTKIIRVANGFGSNVLEIRRDDFAWWANPDIIIDSEKQVEAERERLKVNFLSMLPYITNDPSKPVVVKNVALRYALKLQGLNRELINILTYNAAEEDAKSKIHILNNNDMLGAEIANLQEDHLTYMIIFESALDTDAKFEAIRRRKEAYIISWQINAQNSWPEWWMINQTQAMNTANALKMWSQQVTSLQNIWQ